MKRLLVPFFRWSIAHEYEIEVVLIPRFSRVKVKMPQTFA